MVVNQVKKDLRKQRIPILSVIADLDRAVRDSALDELGHGGRGADIHVLGHGRLDQGPGG